MSESLLTFIRKGEVRGNHKYDYYQCACGVEKKFCTTNVRSGHTKSCGCLKKKLAKLHSKTHGLSDSKEYGVWADMIQRCTNPNRKAYKNYGGRGITVCDQWLKFENFIEDMGDAPFDKAELDRRDNNKGYSPDNCRWITRLQNSHNTRRNVNTTWNGVTMCRSEWARQRKISLNTVKSRLCRGWTELEALELVERKTDK
jgi:hypothetical protein